MLIGYIDHLIICQIIKSLFVSKEKLNISKLIRLISLLVSLHIPVGRNSKILLEVEAFKRSLKEQCTNN